MNKEVVNEIIEIIKNLDDPSELYDRIEINDIIITYSFIKEILHKIELYFTYKNNKLKLIMLKDDNNAILECNNEKISICDDNIFDIFEDIEEDFCNKLCEDIVTL